jgi:hypothetical protein
MESILTFITSAPSCSSAYAARALNCFCLGRLACFTSKALTLSTAVIFSKSVKVGDTVSYDTHTTERRRLRRTQKRWQGCRPVPSWFRCYLTAVLLRMLEEETILRRSYLNYGTSVFLTFSSFYTSRLLKIWLPLLWRSTQ